MSLLEKVGSFRNLYKLSNNELCILATEIRAKILNVILKNGGHLASSLGTVELTLALLRVFNPNKDKIIFDVGHQAYSYKILTDRLFAFSTIRQKGGISGFPRINESPYDFFTTGHSSTSISAALGYCKARDIKGEKNDVIAVIGDGALLNGVAFEALNNIDTAKTKVIIVLNDNRMSIGQRTGGMAKHLAQLSANPIYIKIKDCVKDSCHKFNYGNKLEKTLDKVKSKIKSLILPTNVFEEIGINYWGPFDGHNIEQLESVFNLAKQYNNSVIIHVITKKGKGYVPSEENPTKYHGVSSMQIATKPKENIISWSSATAGCLEKIAEKDSDLFVCTAAMADGTKLTNFEKRFPTRFLDVGISEEHLLIFSAGLAAGGLKPVVCIYSTFLQRAADQLVHDICIPNLPVLICIDRAGLVGEDGETHHGVFDLSWFKSVPNITIFSPRDIIDLNFILMNWASNPYPLIVRYTKGNAPKSILRKNNVVLNNIDIFKSEILEEGNEICIISLGSLIPVIIEAHHELKLKHNCLVTLLDLRFIKPLDMATILSLSKRHKFFIVLEESIKTGGIGEEISSNLLENGYKGKVATLAIPDKFISHATKKEQLEECKLTCKNIIKLCEEYDK
ncbi:MAG: 1-deoxy-D-xylulose-5-phosphate synthase [Synergistaceae bacterium]